MSYPYRINSKEEYDLAFAKSISDPESFWNDIASNFLWKKPWDRVLEWNFEEPRVRWFEGGTLNITENALDRHVATQPNTLAIQWEPNDPSKPGLKLTYRQLLDRVMECAHMFQNNGMKKGDRICVYMPMVPELPIALLAIARIGAIHSVVFGGFSAQSIADRINDSACSMVITADYAHRGAKKIPLKTVVNDALVLCTSVQKVFVFPNTGDAVPMGPVTRDLRWNAELQKVRDAAPGFFPAAEMQAEDMLFILYTSGSTGRPKGVVHTCAGYMVWATYTFVNAFHYEPGDLHFCTADIGWITGHSYILYGPLCAGASVLMYEGLPNWPDPGRLWDIVDKHEVNILYTAPTAIRSLMQNGDQWLQGKQLDSLKTLGSVGEPINVEAWKWFHEKVGHGRLPLVDTWWQTETGGIMISGVAGVTESIPAWAGLPLPGVQPSLMDEHGREIEGEGQGNLCIAFPWPGMIRTTYGDHERCRLNYFSAYPGMYFTGDGAMRDEHGNYRITGRVDDVLNVSGHRIGTAELENAINMHPAVVESAVVGYPHEIKGQGIYAYVILGSETADTAGMQQEISRTVAGIIGAIARPDKVQIVPGLPKTRSGKIMRRILRKIAEGQSQDLGDVSTLLDPAVVNAIVKGYIT